MTTTEKSIRAEISKATKELKTKHEQVEKMGAEINAERGRFISWSAEMEIRNNTYRRLRDECDKLLEQINELKQRLDAADAKNRQTFANMGITVPVSKSHV
jgi:predicted  nucleic acid-binding Zn-ribbon protein